MNYEQKRQEMRRKANKKYRLANIEKVAKINKDYQQSDAGKSSMKRNKANMLIKYPEKAKAREKLNDAVKSGQIIKPLTCSCGNGGVIHGHHFDYGKPLDVVWVCTKCHTILHKGLEELIEACGTSFDCMYAPRDTVTHWSARGYAPAGRTTCFGPTAIEAVSALYLALHKNV